MLQVARHLFRNLGELVGKFPDESDFPCIRTRGHIVSMSGDSLLNSIACSEWGSKLAFLDGNESGDIKEFDTSFKKLNEMRDSQVFNGDPITESENCKTKLSDTGSAEYHSNPETASVSQHNDIVDCKTHKDMSGPEQRDQEGHVEERKQLQTGFENEREESEKENKESVSDDDSIDNLGTQYNKTNNKALPDLSKFEEKLSSDPFLLQESDSQLSFVTAVETNDIDSNGKVTKENSTTDLEEKYFDSYECLDKNQRGGGLNARPDILGFQSENELDSRKVRGTSSDPVMSDREVISPSVMDSRPDLNYAFMHGEDSEDEGVDTEDTINPNESDETDHNPLDFTDQLESNITDKCEKTEDEQKTVIHISKTMSFKEVVESFTDLGSLEEETLVETVRESEPLKPVIVTVEIVNLKDMQVPRYQAGAVTLGRCEVDVSMLELVFRCWSWFFSTSGCFTI